ncbi:MAG: DUF1206 domain-containing protein [Salinimicrobium sp.]
MTWISKKDRFINFLPVFGSFSTALIYSSIGVIAILSFLRIKHGGADAKSLLAFLDDYFFGKIIVGLILLGLVSFVIWRIFEAIKDPYKYGSDFSGMSKRTGIGLSSLADAFIAYAAAKALFNFGRLHEHGQPRQQRETIAQFLEQDWGRWLVIGLGIAIFATAVVQFFYGLSHGYRERLDIARFNKEKKQLIHFFGWMGYSARGIIIGIIGFSLLVAGFTKDAGHSVNTDKAFNFIGENIGNLPFVLVAIGTICYGLFMVAMGITYDVDNDPSDTKT